MNVLLNKKLENCGNDYGKFAEEMTKTSLALMHLLQKLKKTLPSNSALLKEVNSIEESLRSLPYLKTATIKDKAQAFLDTVQSGGPLAHLSTNAKCSKLIVTMMKQTEELVPSPHITTQKDSRQKNVSVQYI